MDIKTLTYNDKLLTKIFINNLRDYIGNSNYLRMVKYDIHEIFKVLLDNGIISYFDFRDLDNIQSEYIKEQIKNEQIKLTFCNLLSISKLHFSIGNFIQYMVNCGININDYLEVTKTNHKMNDDCRLIMENEFKIVNMDDTRQLLIYGCYLMFYNIEVRKVEINNTNINEILNYNRFGDVKNYFTIRGDIKNGKYNDNKRRYNDYDNIGSNNNNKKRLEVIRQSDRELGKSKNEEKTIIDDGIKEKEEKREETMNKFKESYLNPFYETGGSMKDDRMNVVINNKIVEDEIDNFIRSSINEKEKKYFVKEKDYYLDNREELELIEDEEIKKEYKYYYSCKKDNITCFNSVIYHDKDLTPLLINCCKEKSLSMIKYLIMERRGNYVKLITSGYKFPKVSVDCLKKACLFVDSKLNPEVFDVLIRKLNPEAENYNVSTNGKSKFIDSDDKDYDTVIHKIVSMDDIDRFKKKFRPERIRDPARLLRFLVAQGKLKCLKYFLSLGIKREMMTLVIQATMKSRNKTMLEILFNYGDMEDFNYMKREMNEQGLLSTIDKFTVAFTQFYELKLKSLLK